MSGCFAHTALSAAGSSPFTLSLPGSPFAGSPPGSGLSPSSGLAGSVPDMVDACMGLPPHAPTMIRPTTRMRMVRFYAHITAVFRIDPRDREPLPDPAVRRRRAAQPEGHLVVGGVRDRARCQGERRLQG